MHFRFHSFRPKHTGKHFHWRRLQSFFDWEIHKFCLWWASFQVLNTFCKILWIVKISFFFSEIFRYSDGFQSFSKMIKIFRSWKFKKLKKKWKFFFFKVSKIWKKKFSKCLLSFIFLLNPHQKIKPIYLWPLATLEIVTFLKKSENLRLVSPGITAISIVLIVPYIFAEAEFVMNLVFSRE